MYTAIGRKQMPVSNRVLKEVRTKDGEASISVIEYKYNSGLTIVAVYVVNIKKHGKPFDKMIFNDKGDALDQYYDLIFMAYRNNQELEKVNWSY